MMRFLDVFREPICFSHFEHIQIGMWSRSGQRGGRLMRGFEKKGGWFLWSSCLNSQLLDSHPAPPAAQ